MSFLMSCGICCMLLSIWAIIQLTLMGFLFHFQVPIVFEEVEPHSYKDYADFIAKTEANYAKVAVNCWIAAAIYFVTLLLSFLCLHSAKKTAKREALKLEDDEFICSQEVDPLKKDKKKKDIKEKKEKTKKMYSN